MIEYGTVQSSPLRYRTIEFFVLHVHMARVLLGFDLENS